VPDRLRSQQGLTLSELSITMSIVLTLFALVVPVLGSAFRSFRDVSERVDTNSQAQLALNQVERDVRSGNVIAAPGPVGADAGMEVRVYTQANGVLQCVQYRVADGRLERRTRAPGLAVPWPTLWYTVTEGVENATQSPPIPAFTRSADRQMLTIDLQVNRNNPGKGVRLTTSATGRNTKYYDTPFAEEKCD
jgi:type II secretory pathway pseudopilin PulG